MLQSQCQLQEKTAFVGNYFGQCISGTIVLEHQWKWTSYIMVLVCSVMQICCCKIILKIAIHGTLDIYLNVFDIETAATFFWKGSNVSKEPFCWMFWVATFDYDIIFSSSKSVLWFLQTSIRQLFVLTLKSLYRTFVETTIISIL